jgi:hypothetical protein
MHKSRRGQGQWQGTANQHCRMKWVVGEFRQAMQNSAGPVRQVGRVMMNARRDLAHDGPAIRDHWMILKKDLYIIFYM